MSFRLRRAAPHLPETVVGRFLLASAIGIATYEGLTGTCMGAARKMLTVI